MLTKDLVRYRVHKKKVRPSFIDPTDEHLLWTAGALIDVFTEYVGSSRSVLLEHSANVIEGSPVEAAISRGLEKLLLDRTEITAPDDEETPAFRHAVFSLSSSLLAEPNHIDLNDYYQRFDAAYGRSHAEVADHLFLDLPAYHPVTAFKPITAEMLLHRYNCSLIQWLLLGAEKLELSLPKTSRTASLRQLFKYLRFQQLLARIELRNKVYKITVDGPLSLFGMQRRYGLNLARFFPAVLHQEQWELHAQIRPRKTGIFELNLDQSVGIQSDPAQFHAYIPDEYTHFENAFKQKIKHWNIKKTANFIPLEGSSYCFPDYTLRHDDGREIGLELFHRWHGAHLSERLAQLNEEKPVLLIGVATHFKKDPLLVQLLEESACFARYGFYFRDIPTAGQVKTILDRL